MNETIKVMIQGFYGNRTITEIKEEDFDYILQGILDKEIIPIKKDRIGRSIIHIPNAEHIVIVYNHYQEEEKKKGTNIKPVVNIPEGNISLHSRCIICRINDKGKFESLQTKDFDKFIDYLAE